MTRMRVTLPAVIALGSNQGDREFTLRAAVTAISDIVGVTITAGSPLVETPALTPGGIDDAAPAYLNAIVLVRSALSPEQLLPELHRIENEHGRVRTQRWGDRTLDLDLIDFAGLTRDTDTLTLPHPRAHERAFVLHPWLTVDPDASLPGHGRVADLIRTVNDPVTVLEGEPLWGQPVDAREGSATPASTSPTAASPTEATPTQGAPR